MRFWPSPSWCNQFATVSLLVDSPGLLSLLAVVRFLLWAQLCSFKVPVRAVYSNDLLFQRLPGSLSWSRTRTTWRLLSLSLEVCLGWDATALELCARRGERSLGPLLVKSLWGPSSLRKSDRRALVRSLQCRFWPETFEQFAELAGRLMPNRKKRKVPEPHFSRLEISRRKRSVFIGLQGLALSWVSRSRPLLFCVTWSSPALPTWRAVKF